MREPAHYIAMTLHRSPLPDRSHLTGQLHQDLVLPAGSHLHLRKEGEQYVLQVIPGKLPGTKKQQAELELGNAPRGALRDGPSAEPPF